METNRSSEVYYFWTDSETNTHGVTVADSESDFAVVEEFTVDELSAITAPENEGGNGEGAAWGDAVVSEDGSRLFVNARNADKVVVIDTQSREIETILDVGDRRVHSYSYNGELWVHVDGDGGFNIIDQKTLEVSELVEANTLGTGHGKLLVSEGLGNETYATNTNEPAVFPINTETREVGAPIEIAGGNPEIGTHDKGYDPATGLAFFQLTEDAGFSFIDAETNEVVFDLVPIVGRITHTPDDDYILILNADADRNDVGIWNTTLDTHTQPEFDSEVTVGGGVAVNGTEFYLDGEDWEAWIPQTEGDSVAVLNLSTNEVEYIDVGNLTAPEGTRHFSRRGGIDSDYFFTYFDEGGVRIDLDSSEVSEPIPLGGDIARMAVVETIEAEPAVFEFTAQGQIAGWQAEGQFSYDASQTYEDGIVREEDLLSFDISFFDPEGNLLRTYEDNHLTFAEFNFAFDTNTGELLQDGEFTGDSGFNFGEKTATGTDEFTGLNLFSRPALNPFGEVPPPHFHFDDWGDEFEFPIGFGSHEDVSFFTQTTQELLDTGRVGDAYRDNVASDLNETGQRIEVTPVIEAESYLKSVFGTFEADTIEVTGSNQLVFAGDMNDLVDASMGNGSNRVYAGSGDDTLILGKSVPQSGSRGDRAFGAEGADHFFVSNGGNNTMTGGEGADQFWVATASLAHSLAPYGDAGSLAEIPKATNTITDFTIGEDVIGIAGLGISYDDITITSQGNDALISTNNSDLGIIQNIDADSLSESDFAFA